MFLGIIKAEEHAENLANYQTYYIEYSFNFDIISDIISSKGEVLSDLYDWGTNDVNFGKLFSRLLPILTSIFGNFVRIRELSKKVEEKLFGTSLPTSYDKYMQVFLPIYRTLGIDRSEIGITLFPARVDVTDASKTGVVVSPYFFNLANLSEIKLTPNSAWYIVPNIDVGVNTNILWIQKPNLKGEIKIINSDSGKVSAPNDIKVSLKIGFKEEEPFNLVKLNALNIDAKHFYFLTGFDIIDTLNDGPDAFFELGLEDIRILFDQKQGDGLLKKALPKNTDNNNSSFNIILRYSRKNGLTFKGSGSLSYEIKLHNNSKINFYSVIFKIDVENGLKLLVLTSLKLDIGNVNIDIKRFGASVSLEYNADLNGNLGLFNADLGFAPPTGIGIAIKSSAVNGGGFLDVDAPNHKYVGALELKIQKISIVAIGILKTKLPGGREGYSLLLLITVQGFNPIQLGFGFALAGVGGLLGLNHTANLQALRDGLRTGANQSILFPTNIVANADKIISDLETCFPDKEGRFLIGPMAKIVWGAPKALITIDLGLIIEIPSPVMIAILGVVKAILPDENNPKLTIKINFLGTLEFDKKLISFDATIYDSKILTMSISGDMAFRLKWGDQSNFLLSVGGFHPSYTPPPLNLPTLRRLAITLVDKEHFKVGLETYFAITSNTVQVGAKVMAYAEQGSYNALGLLYLDVLFQFSPFYFTAAMGAMIAIRKGTTVLLSASIQATLKGPSPWNVCGSVEFKVLCIGFKIDFNETFGDQDNQKLADKAIWPDLLEALKHKDNWTTLLPERNQLFVSTRGENDPAIHYLHPLGRLAVSQRLTPLNFLLSKFGHVKPADYKKFFIDTVTNGATAIAFNTVKDKFSPSQFIQMGDHEKLSRPSFEDFESGISIGTENLVSSYSVVKELKYQQPKIFDRRMKTIITDVAYHETEAFSHDVMTNGAVNNSFSNPVKSNNPYDGPPQTTLKPKQFAVANKSDLTAFNTQLFTSVAEAQACVNQIVLSAPAQKNKLIVTGALELA